MILGKQQKLLCLEQTVSGGYGQLLQYKHQLKVILKNGEANKATQFVVVNAATKNQQTKCTSVGKEKVTLRKSNTIGEFTVKMFIIIMKHQI